MSKSAETERRAQAAPDGPTPEAAGPADAACARIAAFGSAKPAPVERWNPPYCGDLDIRIARDGAWFYLGTPIGRERLVKLFASVLRRDADGRFYLVTPVEKVGVTVEDAPFIAVDFETRGAGRDREIDFTTALGDVAQLGPERPLRLADGAEPAPYVLVRGRLEARIDRKTFFRLAELAEPARRGGGGPHGVWSRGAFFPLEPDPTEPTP